MTNNKKNFYFYFKLLEKKEKKEIYTKERNLFRIIED